MDDHPAPPAFAPQEWIDALERADADVAAGDVEPWSIVRARLIASLDDTPAKQARRHA